ncbi:MAG: HprK-related kinase A [Methylobacter sp.]|nr:MAG: HprK-related kinase A [Methylobacter sp.]
MENIVLQVGPFTVKLESALSAVGNSVRKLYPNDFVVAGESAVFADFHIKIAQPSLIRSWYKPQVQFYADGKAPFKPLPLSQAYPFFEWGLNWCIATHVFNYLLIHAAVLEKQGCALILSGMPGAGKSTLCAALANRGWRLLSDEMAVVDLQSNAVIPIVRPISLKNQAIAILKDFAPKAVFGDSFYDTAKGTVAHMKPSDDSIGKASQTADAKWIVFPRYQADAQTRLLPLPKGQVVLKLAENSFNYSILGGQGFMAMCDLVERSQCYEFEYSNLDEAIALFAGLQ